MANKGLTYLRSDSVRPTRERPRTHRIVKGYPLAASFIMARYYVVGRRLDPHPCFVSWRTNTSIPAMQLVAAGGRWLRCAGGAIRGS